MRGPERGRVFLARRRLPTPLRRRGESTGADWSAFGLEIYSVNGKEVLRKRSFSIRALSKFVVGEGEEKHDVEIKMDLFPTLKSWIFPGHWVAQAYVDGELVVGDLTPQVRRTVRLVDKIMNWILVAVTASALAVVVIYFVVRYAIPR